MISIAEIGAGISSLRTALEIAKAMREITDATERNSKILELQSAIMDAQASAIQVQSAHATQLDQIRVLEAEIADLKAWDAEKKCYELEQLGDGIFAYASKPSMQLGTPKHYICPDCYQNGVKSLLQKVIRVPGMDHVLLCQRCKWEIYTTGQWRPDHGGTKSASRGK